MVIEGCEGVERLYPGRNTIYFTGISGTVKVAPNWWTV